MGAHSEAFGSGTSSGRSANANYTPHAVQFYERDAFLADAVARFLIDGFHAGQAAVVVATPGHLRLFHQRLAPHGVDDLLQSGRLRTFDADETLALLMRDGMPDTERFHALVAQLVVAQRTRPDEPPPRVYGEMVDVLWERGQVAAAFRLEELWNEAIEMHRVSLLCGYRMGNFTRETHAASFAAICSQHERISPTENYLALPSEAERLREVSVLQQRARALEAEIEERKRLEVALREALNARFAVTEQLRRLVERERDARAKAEASDTFKEIFLGMLGHDLRNPLNTILTTARLMLLGGSLAADSGKRMARIVSSGERMARMIEQILDVTRARLAAGIPVDRSRSHPLTTLVTKIVDECRCAQPGRVIELAVDGACHAHVDPDRFEQVVSNLIGNAIAHGDSERPIRAVLSEREGAITLSVHNFGPAIEASALPLLFDPWKRGGVPQGRSDGLGLGLYISQRIVEAHAGTIEVRSSEATGTTFEVRLGPQ